MLSPNFLNGFVVNSVKNKAKLNTVMTPICAYVASCIEAIATPNNNFRRY